MLPHRARMARDRGDKKEIRDLAAQVMATWRHHLQLREEQNRGINAALERMLAADTHLGGRGTREALASVEGENAAPRVKQEE